MVIAESFARIFRQNMFNCGMLAIEMPTAEIAGLFDSYAGKVCEMSVDLDRKELKISAGDQTDTLAVSISEFDEALVRAGGWVDYADKNY